MKKVTQVLESRWQSEGRGAKVRRSIGRPELRSLDPFLMLDEFQGSSTEGAGFPDHPHRGFETVSYLLEGEFTHEDFTGRKGTLQPGDLQWMTAGRGIVHSEMPGPMLTRGLQLWVNLKREFKMVEPAYQEHTADQIVRAEQGGVSVKVIAGESMGVKSPVRTRTPTYFLDFRLEPQAKFTQTVPKDWTTFVYTLLGEVSFGSNQKQVKAHHTVVFSSEHEDVSFENTGTDAAHFVLIAGQPIKEPVVQRGPFVMNTQSEIMQAMEDYQLSKNGFENAREWQSVEGNK